MDEAAGSSLVVPIFVANAVILAGLLYLYRARYQRQQAPPAAAAAAGDETKVSSPTVHSLQGMDSYISLCPSSTASLHTLHATHTPSGYVNPSPSLAPPRIHPPLAVPSPPPPLPPLLLAMGFLLLPKLLLI